MPQINESFQFDVYRENICLDSALVSSISAAAAAAFPACSAAESRPEGAPELERHDVVKYRVDDGADVVEDPGCVEQDGLQRLAGGTMLLDVIRAGVDRDQTLRVERSPADEERDHHRHYIHRPSYTSSRTQIGKAKYSHPAHVTRLACRLRANVYTCK